MNLLIHADPGARSGFIAAWLTNCLTSSEFDSGIAHRPKFVKIHQLKNDDSIIKHHGIKIRVKPSVTVIDLHCLLFLRKNVHVQNKNFTRDEYSIETFDKLTYFAKEILAEDCKLNYSLYDIIIEFADTFNNNHMIDLYIHVNKTAPSPEMIKVLKKTNIINNININKNHACSILKLCLEKEQALELKEECRFWSIDDVYNNTPVNKLYDTVNKMIVPENYDLINC